MEIRCPIHGFIRLNEWETRIIGHPLFQRLRRIKQLAWTDLVYPGAMHTRFEHSLGVMYLATRIFDSVWESQREALKLLNFDEDAAKRHRQLIRLATLLHDIGHSPFSHAGEELFPKKEDGKPYKHEAYSIELIRELMKEAIDEDKLNKFGHNIRAAEVANFIAGEEAAKLDAPLVFWRQLLTSQLDADRMDYLLRDSYHVGVRYGHYDLGRILVSMTVAVDENENPILAIDEGGWHAAEALIIARYMMFTQVYFHKTRVIYDYHSQEALKEILREDQASSGLAQIDRFPPPDTETHLQMYKGWDDWRVLGRIQGGGGGEHGAILRDRAHFRQVYQIGEIDDNKADKLYSKIKKKLEKANLLRYEYRAGKDWYSKSDEIYIASPNDDPKQRRVRPLSEYSRVVNEIERTDLRRLYVAEVNKTSARGIIEKTK